MENNRRKTADKLCLRKRKSRMPTAKTFTKRIDSSVNIYYNLQKVLLVQNKGSG